MLQEMSWDPLMHLQSSQEACGLLNMWHKPMACKERMVECVVNMWANITLTLIVGDGSDVVDRPCQLSRLAP